MAGHLGRLAIAVLLYKKSISYKVKYDWIARAYFSSLWSEMHMGMPKRFIFSARRRRPPKALCHTARIYSFSANSSKNLNVTGIILIYNIISYNYNLKSEEGLS